MLHFTVVCLIELQYAQSLCITVELWKGSRGVQLHGDRLQRLGEWSCSPFLLSLSADHQALRCCQCLWRQNLLKHSCGGSDLLNLNDPSCNLKNMWKDMLICAICMWIFLNFLEENESVSGTWDFWLLTCIAGCSGVTMHYQLLWHWYWLCWSL